MKGLDFVITEKKKKNQLDGPAVAVAFDIGFILYFLLMNKNFIFFNFIPKKIIFLIITLSLSVSIQRNNCTQVGYLISSFSRVPLSFFILKKYKNII